MVDGADQKIRVIPKTSADKKLLEFISQWDLAKLKTTRKLVVVSTGKEIEHIDLVLKLEEAEPDQDGNVAYQVIDIPVA